MAGSKPATRFVDSAMLAPAAYSGYHDVLITCPLTGRPVSGATWMRVKDRGEPDPRTPWDEIVPGLFMGGHFYRDAADELVPVLVREEFDVVISLYNRDGHGPSGTVAHHLREVPDGPLSAAQLAAVSELAEIAAEALKGGRKILARCHSGYNRSGLVIVQALAYLGYRVDDAIFLVRRRRSKWALNNQLFVDYLTTGLDVAQLLTGLGT